MSRLILLAMMFCFGGHCHISRPIRFHTMLACEQMLPTFTKGAAKAFTGRVVAQCVAD